MNWAAYVKYIYIYIYIYIYEIRVAYIIYRVRQKNVYTLNEKKNQNQG